MNLPLTLALAITAGLHAALYGAWKDSPHESFRITRFCRELAIAGCIGVVLYFVAFSCPFLVLLSAFALSRIATEFYKLFLRREKQNGYRIPTQVHWLGHVVTHRSVRFILGIGYLAAIYGLYALLRLLPDSTSPHLLGPVAGILLGTSLAIGGAYKDGFIEGFYLRKFVKSPLAAALGGWIVSFHTGSPAFIVLGAMALERMFNELFFKLLRPGYVPGKFKSEVARYPEWLALRKRFIGPYVLTWIVIVALGAFW